MPEAMTETSFQRARKPQERSIRREAILAAAAELFDAEGAMGAGLNAIAARAGFTKSNVYRYFESREEVLLSLFVTEIGAFRTGLVTALAGCREGDIEALAAAAAAAFVTRPRFCQLLSILSVILEQNVSEATVLAVKRATLDDIVAVAAALHRKLPGTTLEDCGWVASMAGTLVAGMWPGAHPAPAAASVLSRPEYAGLKPDLDRDLPRAIAALLRDVIRRG